MVDNEYSWSQVNESDFSKKIYGKEFATEVANSLEQKTQLFHNTHRDYCGTGFYYQNGKYMFCYVYDGFPDKHIKEFDNRDNFIEWLGAQNDWNMSGCNPEAVELFEKDLFTRNNQRCLKKTLETFLS